MSSIKFNLIKIEKALVYQPLWYDPSLEPNIVGIENYIRITNTDPTLSFKFYPKGSIALYADSLHMGLNAGGISSGSYQVKSFENNTNRDIYYNKILLNIDQVLLVIKESNNRF